MSRRTKIPMPKLFTKFERRAFRSERVTVADRFHMGSASVCVKFVEEREKRAK